MSTRAERVNALRNGSDVKFQQDRVKYGTYIGGKRRGEIGSIFDMKATQRRIEDMYDNLGEGAIQVCYKNPVSGDPYAGAIIEDDQGYELELDENGSYVAHDEGYVDVMIKLAEQRQKKIDDDMEKVILEDGIAKRLLGTTSWGWCEAGQGPSGMSAEMKALDCKPSTIQSFPTNSVQQSVRYSKLRFIVSHTSIHFKSRVKTGTTDSAIDQGTH